MKKLFVLIPSVIVVALFAFGMSEPTEPTAPPPALVLEKYPNTPLSSPYTEADGGEMLGIASAKYEAFTDKNLLTIHLGGGTLSSIGIGTHHGGETYLDPSTWEDYDGVRLVAAFPGQRIVPRPHDAYTINIGESARFVKLEGFEIAAGTIGNIFGIPEAFGTPERHSASLWIVDCKLIDRVDGLLSKWGIQAYGLDVVAVGLIVDLRNAREHGAYAHTLGTEGLWVFLNCQFVNIRSQAIKAVSRPNAALFLAYWGFIPGGLSDLPNGTAWHGPGSLIWVENTAITNFGLPNNDRGGGGIVLEGSGAENIFIRRNLIHPGENGSGLGIGIDGVLNADGLGRFFSPNGVPGLPPGQSNVVIEHNLIETTDPKRPAFRVLSVANLWVHQNGVYSTPKSSNIKDVTGTLVVSGNNDNVIDSIADAYGYSSDNEASVAYPSHTYSPISVDRTETATP